MNMPWADARDFAEAVAEEKRRAWLDMATAVRASRVDQKDWGRIVRDING